MSIRKALEVFPSVPNGRNTLLETVEAILSLPADTSQDTEVLVRSMGTSQPQLLYQSHLPAQEYEHLLVWGSLAAAPRQMHLKTLI